MVAFFVLFDLGFGDFDLQFAKKSEFAAAD